MEVRSPKFELGQKVWMLDDEQKAVEREISSASINVAKDYQSVSYYLVTDTPYASDTYRSYAESKLFATKEDLKKSIFGD